MHDPVDLVEASYIARAAKGDPDAQGAFVHWAVSLADSGQMPLAECAVMAELMGRMAAAHGRPEDRSVLVLALQLSARAARASGRTEAAMGFEAECVALLNEAADEGCEGSADLLMSWADILAPETIALAGKLKRRTTDTASWLAYPETAEG
ncbi:MAG: hypothetical protein ACOY5R_00970 [Pseudomonadota bacterium]